MKLSNLLRMFAGVALLGLSSCSNPARNENQIWLGDAHPNPMHLGESTTIPYRVSDEREVRLEIVNSLGQEVREPLRLSAGEGNLVWDGLDRHGRQCGEGVYFIKLVSQDDSHHVKIVMLR